MGEGEAPAEPNAGSRYQLGGSLALPETRYPKALHDNYLPVLWISRGALARGLSRMNRGLAPGG